MGKIQATKIVFHRAEGRTHECVPLTFEGEKCWSAAESIVRGAAYTAPEHGGYDKCDVFITFSDGFTYKSRYDLYHPNTDKFESIASHVRREWEFYAGRRIPPRMRRESWERLVQDLGVVPLTWVGYCERYEIGGAS